MAAERQFGVGFGLDKLKYRHNIGGTPYTTAAAVTAARWALQSNAFAPKSDGWGAGYNTFSRVQRGRNCAKDSEGKPIYSAETCDEFDERELVAAFTTGGSDYDDLGGMPAGTPLGLQTIYCVTDGTANEPIDLRCPGWVTEAMYISGGGTP